VSRLADRVTLGNLVIRPPGRCRRAPAQLVEALTALARLQSLETGLPLADSRAAVQAVTTLARSMLAQPSASGTGKAAALAVSGHVLSWGLPLAEVTCAVLPHPLAGHTAVIKPSLRAPMSAAAVAHLATCMGFPPGVINIVQGTEHGP
jgi:acyl-CoA reductase-like NAD-dependent aldehyde dehydrogenase